MNKELTKAEAEKLAISTLKQVMEEKLNNTNVEVGIVTTESKRFQLYSQQELSDLIARDLDTEI